MTKDKLNSLLHQWNDLHHQGVNQNAGQKSQLPNSCSAPSDSKDEKSTDLIRDILDTLVDMARHEEASPGGNSQNASLAPKSFNNACLEMPVADRNLRLAFELVFKNSVYPNISIGDGTPKSLAASSWACLEHTVQGLLEIIMNRAQSEIGKLLQRKYLKETLAAWIELKSEESIPSSTMKSLLVACGRFDATFMDLLSLLGMYSRSNLFACRKLCSRLLSMLLIIPDALEPILISFCGQHEPGDQVKKMIVQLFLHLIHTELNCFKEMTFPELVRIAKVDDSTCGSLVGYIVSSLYTNAAFKQVFPELIFDERVDRKGAIALWIHALSSELPNEGLLACCMDNLKWFLDCFSDPSSPEQDNLQSDVIQILEILNRTMGPENLVQKLLALETCSSALKIISKMQDRSVFLITVQSLSMKITEACKTNMNHAQEEAVALERFVSAEISLLLGTDLRFFEVIDRIAEISKETSLSLMDIVVQQKLIDSQKQRAQFALEELVDDSNLDVRNSASRLLGRLYEISEIDTDQSENEKCTLNSLLEDLKSEQIPDRAFALTELRKLAEKQDPVLTTTVIRKLLHLLFNHINDSESYLFTNAIKTLSALSSAYPSLCLNRLLDIFSDGLHTPTEQRQKIGEVIFQLIQKQFNSCYFRDHQKDLYSRFYQLSLTESDLSVRYSAMGITGLILRVYARDLLSELPNVAQLLTKLQDVHVPAEIQWASWAMIVDFMKGIETSNLIPDAHSHSMKHVYELALSNIGNQDQIISSAAQEILQILST